ncbi:Uma2 family endonuclease [Cohnella candidum]|uniref:Uma2 family endonuclease n=1 Tax=Cohnella candidum TaxID=2674991 RepID=UPI001F14F384|nr:Uma2 family endonuclease [Cohnella candidum]
METLCIPAAQRGPDNRDHKDRYQGIPALAVEVLSVSTRSKDLVKKLDLYMQCAVKEYWVVDPINESVTIYQLADGDILNNSTYLKSADQETESYHFGGLRVALREIFG